MYAIRSYYGFCRHCLHLLWMRNRGIMAEKSWQRTLVGALLRYRLAVLAVIALISLFVLSPFVINPKVLFEQKQGKVSAQDDSGRDLISMAKKFGQGEPLLLIT